MGRAFPKPSYDESYNDLIRNDFSGDERYDAATAIWGAPARMPKVEEFEELINTCSTSWTALNGVYGRLVTGPNGNSIFLSAAGHKYGASAYYTEVAGHYWSSSSFEYDGVNGFYLSFDESKFDYGAYRSYLRHTIRPVRN